MTIDLRTVPTRWINLDEHVENARAMEAQFHRLGFTCTERISAAKLPPPEGANPAFGTHYIGCGTSHLRCFARSATLPALILEDDALATEHFCPVLEIPDDADAIYLGVSNASPNTRAVDLRSPEGRAQNRQGWARIEGMLATHAILYVSERYTRIAEYSTRHCIETLKVPLDMGFAMLQEKFRVYAAIHPFFIQADDRQNANKWEALTRELKITHIG